MSVFADLQLCLCGTSAGGYAHALDCPYPLFNPQERGNAAYAWLEAREAKRRGKCPVCVTPIAPDDLDVRYSFERVFHAACLARARAAEAVADLELAKRAVAAHDRGGWCPLCRKVRPAGSDCWGE